MWQGIFTQRNNNGCKSLSSLVCIDIDHQTEQDLEHIRQIIKTWPFVLAFFVSPSGDGLKVLVRTDNLSIDDYSNCYRQVEKLFTDEFGIQPDSSCEDLSHTCFISYDPDMYCNPNSQPWHYEYDSTFDKPKPSLYSGSSSHSRCGNPDKPFLTVEGFIAEMNRMRCTLTDEQIINILDIKWSKFPNNYQDGNRTKSVFIQASALCKAGIDMDKALEYLKSKFLPTGLIRIKWDVRFIMLTIETSISLVVNGVTTGPITSISQDIKSRNRSTQSRVGLYFLFRSKNWYSWILEKFATLSYLFF